MATNPIKAYGSISGNQPRVNSIAEDALQTFLLGTPVMVNQVTNGVVAWDGVTIANGIAGIAVNDASNLATLGVPQQLTYGTVPNEPSAVHIPIGAPFNDGNMLIEIAADDSIFLGQVGPSQLNTSVVFGTNYGLTKDTDNHWYVDLTIANQPNSVLVVQSIDSNDPRGVRFIFLSEVQQLAG